MQDWPVRFATLIRSPEDIGVGDTIARTIGPFGGEAVKAFIKSLGEDCGCDARQDLLNKKYPYPVDKVDAESKIPTAKPGG